MPYLAFINLRILHLRNCSLPFQFDGFIRVLARCLQLEELQSDSSLSCLVYTLPREMPPTPPPVKLECLRVLVIDDACPSAISAVITHIEAPGITTLRILCYNRHRAEAENLLRTSFPGNPTRISSRLSASPVKVHLYLKGSTDVCIIEVSESDVHVPGCSDVTLPLRWLRL